MRWSSFQSRLCFLYRWSNGRIGVVDYWI